MKKMKSWILALAVMAVVTTFAGSALAKTDAAQNDQQTTYAVAKAACQNSAMPATNQINLVSAATAVDTSPAAKFAVMTTAVTTLENCTVVDAATANVAMADAGAAVAQITSGRGDFDVILPTVAGFHAHAGYVLATASAIVAT